MWFAFKRRPRYNSEMKPAAGLVILFGLAAGGCGAARDVGHVVAAPAQLVHREFSGKPSPTPVPSDVDVPGAPVTATPSPSPRLAENSPSLKSKASPSPSPRAVSNQPQFPVAKAVPGKPGLVYNPFDPSGGLIDVKGYAPGSKVKDPDSQKIFIVP